MRGIDPKRVLLVIVAAAGFAALFQLAALVLTLTSSAPPSEVSQLAPAGQSPSPGPSADPTFPSITPFPIAYVDPGPLLVPATPTPTPAVKPPPPNRERCGAQPNPWDYTFCGGALIHNPPPDFCHIFPCVRDFQANGGYIVQCGNGLFSATGGTSRACQRDRGVARTLFAHEE